MSHMAQKIGWFANDTPFLLIWLITVNLIYIFKYSNFVEFFYIDAKFNFNEQIWAHCTPKAYELLMLLHFAPLHHIENTLLSCAIYCGPAKCI